tara:strand:- start:152 stop:601 length:450 start_codon:yes stop_codon:yes gene_type:complete
MSKLQVDTIEGKTTAGSITVTSEGTAVETNLQQGLAKSWCYINGDGTASLTDSFNGTSMTDNGTGDYTFTIANDFSSATSRNCTMGCWMNEGGSGLTNATRGVFMYQAPNVSATAGDIRVNFQYGSDGSGDGAVNDSDAIYLTLHGDLA